MSIHCTYRGEHITQPTEILPTGWSFILLIPQHTNHHWRDLWSLTDIFPWVTQSSEKFTRGWVQKNRVYGLMMALHIQTIDQRQKYFSLCCIMSFNLRYNIHNFWHRNHILWQMFLKYEIRYNQDVFHCSALLRSQHWLGNGLECMKLLITYNRLW